MVAKWWQNYQKNIKKYELILKSGNYKKSREIAEGAEYDHGAAFCEKVRKTSFATGKK